MASQAGSRVRRSGAGFVWGICWRHLREQRRQVRRRAVATEARVVAVAGGTGFVGGGIARELASRGHHVIVLSHRPPATGSRGKEPTPAVEFRQADVTRPDSLVTALAGVDALVISLAFRNSPIEAPRRGQTFEKVDAAGTEALVAAAKAAGVRRLVYMLS